jgi:hypothetical protein
MIKANHKNIVISLSQPCDKGHALNSAAFERLPVPNAILRDVAAGALWITLLVCWHSANLTNF